MAPSGRPGGDAYRILFSAHVSASFSGPVNVFTSTSVLRFISASGTSNFIQRVVQHLTVNAAGEVTTNFSLGSTECLG